MVFVNICVHMYLRLSYQWIFEVHESPLVQGKPAFFEAFSLLQRRVERQSQTGAVQGQEQTAVLPG